MKTGDLRPVEFDAYWHYDLEVRSKPKSKGYFHQWGEKSYSVERGDVRKQIVGVIEAEDGRVYEVPTPNIQFLDT